MGKFNEYSQKATPADNDTLMIYDATSKANKLSPFSGIWNWIVEKLTNAVISNLQTSNQTVIGAINELDNNRAFGTLITSEGHDCNNLGFGIFLLLNPKNGVAEINWHVIISANSNGAQTGFQIAYDLTDGTKAYIRKQASGIWSEWRHFNTSEILSNLTTTNKSSLVDAINELNSNLPAGGIYDLDNPPEKMIFSAMAGSTNLPDDLGGANAVTVIRMKLGSSNFDAMIAFSFSADRIAIRRKGGTENWSKWKYFNAQ